MMLGPYESSELDAVVLVAVIDGNQSVTPISADVRCHGFSDCAVFRQRWPAEILLTGSGEFEIRLRLMLVCVFRPGVLA
jgi:hypothetical protein